MSGHTPGPWEKDGLTVYALMHAGWHKGVEQFKNRFFCGVQGDVECSTRELDANARLIAAAPDLLAALKACRDRLHYLAVNEVGEHPHSLINGLRVSTADEAIAKAEGRS